MQKPWSMLRKIVLTVLQRTKTTLVISKRRKVFSFWFLVILVLAPQNNFIILGVKSSK